MNCPACGLPYTNKKERHKSKHHIFPKRFFRGAGDTIELCRKCHSELETYIPKTHQLSKEKYVRIVEEFLERKRKERY